jgi:hypothetical protein
MSRRTPALYSIRADILGLLTGFVPLPSGAQIIPRAGSRFVVPSTAASGFDTVVRMVGQNLPR